MHFNRHSSLLVLVGSLLVVDGCSYTGPADDAGNAAFVRHAIPAILGRRPYGAAEVAVLEQVASADGRGAVVDLLMALPEFRSHWTQVLIDGLLVDRDGYGASSAACYGRPTLPESAYPQLLQHITTASPLAPFCYSTASQKVAAGPQAPPLQPDLLSPQPPDAAVPPDPYAQTTTEAFAGASFYEAGSPASHIALPAPTAAASPSSLSKGASQTVCPPFNMVDVVAAAVAEDQLSPIYRAYLVPLSTFPRGQSERARRVDQADRFFTAFLGRDASCLTCHSSTFSRTDSRPDNDHWDRFYPSNVDAAGAALSYSSAGEFYYGGDGGTAVNENIIALFRTDVHNENASLFDPLNHNQHAGGVFNPFGFSNTCVLNTAVNFYGFRTGTIVASNPGGLAGRTLDPFGHLWVVDDVMRDSLSAPLSLVPWNYNTNPATLSAAEQQSGADDLQNCMACHNAYDSAPSFADPAFQERIRRMSNHKLGSIVSQGSGKMPPQMGEPLAELFVRYLRSLPQYQYVGPARPASGELGVHLLVSAKAVDNIFNEVTGHSLLLDHGYARNADQEATFSELVYKFVIHGGSLREVLRTIVLSEGVSTNIPADSNAGYGLPPLAHPWDAVAPGDPPNALPEANSRGDWVHRRSVHSLLGSVAAALRWPAPQAFGYQPVGNAVPYPQQQLMVDLGRYETPGNPGIEDVDVSSFLAWEDAFGVCQKPAHVYAGDVVLNDGVVALPGDIVAPSQWRDWIDDLASAAHGKASIFSVASTMRDRLLGGAITDQAEWTAVAPVVYPTEVLVGDGPIIFDAPTHELLLRRYCGVLLRTPQFMLVGIEPSAPNAFPTLDVCTIGECYQQLCADYEARLSALGHTQFACPPAGN